MPSGFDWGVAATDGPSDGHGAWPETLSSTRPNYVRAIGPMIKDLVRDITPPMLWRAASRLKMKFTSSISRPISHEIEASLQTKFAELNANCQPDELQLRKGIKLRVHPDSRNPFEHFCFRDPEMVK
jgi:hypothetical protein